MTAPPRRLGRVATGLLVVGVLGALYAASRISRMLFERPPGPPRLRAGGEAAAGAGGGPEQAPAASEAAGVFQVNAASGQVDAYRAGRWIPVQQGDLLTRDDVVRTASASRAVLRNAAGTEVELREKVEIRLDRLSGPGASLDLRHGKVVARVAGASDALAITARETRTSSEGPAHFVVLADDHGQVSVAAIKGTTRFAAAGKTVTVPEGSQARSAPGGPPSDPEKIPEEVLLQVVWPSGETHGLETAVRGQVSPASVVTVNGAPAEVGPDGRFVATVPLRDGSNVLEVQTEDLAGRTRKAASTVVHRPARPPRLAPVPGELWK
jgi:hypothetical protein